MNYSSAAASRRIQELNGGLDNQETSNFEDQYIMENATGDVSIVQNQIEGSTGQSVTFEVEYDPAVPANGKRPLRLFGAYKNSPNSDLIVTLLDSPLDEFNEEIKTNGYRYTALLYDVVNKAQFSNPIKLSVGDASGNTASGLIHPTRYKDPSNQQDNLLRMSGLNIIANGRTSFDLDINPGEKISLTFTVG